MPRQLRLVCTLILTLTLLGVTLADPGPISVYVNGQAITARAIVQDGVTYVPLRAVARALGVTVDWDARSRSVRIGQRPSSEAEKAVAMVKDTQGALYWDSKVAGPTPSEVLTDEMRCHSGAFDLNGWRAEPVAPGLYLVSFTYRPLSEDARVLTWEKTPPELVRYTSGGEERGWFWEVNVPNHVARFLSIEDFAAAQTRYGLTPAATD